MTLPAAPVTTRQKVKDWAGITGNTHDADLDEIVLAVDEFVRGLESVRVRDQIPVDVDHPAGGWPSLPDALAVPVWPNRYALGAKMLAAKLNRRKNSPEGVATFVGEGVAYVRKNDPDVAAMLRLNYPVAG